MPRPRMAAASQKPAEGATVAMRQQRTFLSSSPSGRSQPARRARPSIAFVRKFAAAATAMLLLARYKRGGPRGCAHAGGNALSPDGLCGTADRLSAIGTYFQ